jgi:hypothetical protein
MHSKALILIIAIVAVIGAGLWLGGSYLLKGENGYLTDSRVAALRENYCKLLGGEMVVTGCGIATCAEKCSIRFRDAGKSCRSSKDCSGKCIIDLAKQSLSGCRKIDDKKFDCTSAGLKPVCETRIIKNCQYGYEYDNGIVTEYGNCTL